MDKKFFHNFLVNLKQVFVPRNLVWHVVAIAVTYISIIFGFDWKYYQFSSSHNVIFVIMSLATPLGFFVPVLLPLTLLLNGWKNIKSRVVAYMIIQAELLACLVSSLYKFFTGRAHPQLIEPNFFDIGTVVTNGTKNISQVFNFGFDRGGIVWGWPSTHTAVAFAMTLAVITLCAENKKMRWVLVYAFYVGLGVSMSIHWFSDFLAGAILGGLIGIIVGRNFRTYKVGI